MNINIPNDKVSFQHSFKVQFDDIDALNHVNNIVYLNWVLEISGMHWDFLKTKEINEKYVWMVLRHEIDYLGQAYLNDTLTLYTWIDKNEGVKSTRIVHIYCADKLIIKSKTIWCLLDAKTLKPKRIGQEILQLFTKLN